MKMSAFLLLSIFFGLLKACAESQDVRDADAVLFENIWKEFGERQASAATADVTWVHRYMMTTNSSALGELRSAGPADMGGTDLLAEQRCRLAVGGRDRLRVEDLIVASSAGRINLLPAVSSFDGTTRWRFTDHSSVNESHSGTISAAKRAVLWSGVHVLPLTMALRPLRPEAFGEESSQWMIESSTGVVDGVACIVMTRHLANSTRTVHLDPLRQFIPLKMTGTSVSITMLYDRSEEPKWVPSSWTSTVYAGQDGGPLESESENELVSAKIGIPLDEDTFRITFPEGTVVLDGRRGGLPATFVAGKDGELIPQRQAVALETTGDSSSFSWPLLLAAGGAAALGIALLIWRRAAAG